MLTFKNYVESNNVIDEATHPDIIFHQNAVKKHLSNVKSLEDAIDGSTKEREAWVKSGKNTKDIDADIKNLHDEHREASEQLVKAQAELKNVAGEINGVPGKHRVQLAISGTGLTQKQQKIVRVQANDKHDAVSKAKQHFSKQGYKVHSATHLGMA